MSYTTSFFVDRRTTALQSAEAMVPWIINLVQPTSVVDVGCGTGTWAAAFQRCGVNDVTGLDGDWVPREQLEIPFECFISTDLSRPFQTDRRYDLVVCLEVAEHIPAGSATQFVTSLVTLGPIVLFSAAAPNQGGVGHLNEQWPAYWIERFEEHGYVCVDCVRGRFWDDPAIAPWYAQNSFVFVASNAVPILPALLEAERGHSLKHKAIIHPRQYFRKIRELQDPKSYSVKSFVRTLPWLLRARLARKDVDAIDR